MGLNMDLCEVSICYIMKASEECESNTPFNIKEPEKKILGKALPITIG
jgi:hypothetical protein